MIETRTIEVAGKKRFQYLRVCSCGDEKWIEYNGNYSKTCNKCRIKSGVSSVAIDGKKEKYPTLDEEQSKKLQEEWLKNNEPTIIEPSKQMLEANLIFEKEEKDETEEDKKITEIGNRLKNYFEKQKQVPEYKKEGFDKVDDYYDFYEAKQYAKKLNIKAA